MPSSTTSETDVGATVLAFLGCQDDQLARHGFSNGLFTENLLAVWGGGAWEGGHAAFHEAIRSRMPDVQQPNYKVVGAENDDFGRAPVHGRLTPDGAVYHTYSAYARRMDVLWACTSGSTGHRRDATRPRSGSVAMTSTTRAKRDQFCCASG